MSQQPVINPTNTTGDTLIDTVMEEATASSSSHVLSHSEIDLTSRDPQEKDIHTQTPITENFPIMDEDPSTSNPDKGKSAESQPASQTNKPNSIEISVLNDIFKQTPQASNKAHKVTPSNLKLTQLQHTNTSPYISERVTRSINI
ncbi:15883_t:CDS:2 [Rhizophagus irregularis]|nr:15883_t:CDS:2 [Rhizophagus irregularis]